MNWFPARRLPLEKVRAIRRSAKSRVLSPTPCERYAVSPTGNIRDIRSWC